MATVSFLAQLHSGFFCLQNIFLSPMLYIALSLELIVLFQLWVLFSQLSYIYFSFLSFVVFLKRHDLEWLFNDAWSQLQFSERKIDSERIHYNSQFNFFIWNVNTNLSIPFADNEFFNIIISFQDKIMHHFGLEDFVRAFQFIANSFDVSEGSGFFKKANCMAPFYREGSAA